MTTIDEVDVKYMKAAEFKAKCLRVMEEIATTGEEVVVTKHGRPVVYVVPPPAPLGARTGVGAGAEFFVPGGNDDLIIPAIPVEDWTGDENNLFSPGDAAPPDARRRDGCAPR